ncbi:MAG: LLM class flavin-dependent oxidoreductase [Bacteroidia bacterium]
MMRIGVLDIGEINRRHSQVVISDLLETAPILEELGFSRFWLGEHHVNGVAWRSPVILISILAGLTERMKIGAAGMQLLLHSPLRVAQDFKLLETIYSGRIDLGLARGLASDLITTALLDSKNNESSKNGGYKVEYERKTAELIAFLNASFDEAHPYNEIAIMPKISAAPDLWMLGTGRSSIPAAIKHKANFCVSLFHSSDNNIDAIPEYKELFVQAHGEPFKECSICISGVCSETTQKAKRIIKNHRNSAFVPTFWGNQAECKEQILSLKEKHGVDEIIVFDLCQEFEDKLSSYKLISEAFNLPAFV